MKFRRIERHDLEPLLPLFAASYPSVDLEDELEYFDELRPSNWLLAEKNGILAGYIRYFPDYQNNFASTEFHFSEKLLEENDIGSFVDNFCSQVPDEINIRFQVPLCKNFLIEAVEKHLPHKVTFLFYEQLLCDLPFLIPSGTKLSNTDEAEQISNILSTLGNYPVNTINKLISTGSIFSYKLNQQVIGACYVIKNGKDYEIEMMAIDEKFQKQGHGSIFLKEMFLLFLNKGAQKVFLKVKHSNSSAVSLYEKNGLVCDNSRSEVWLYKKNIVNP